MDVNTSSQQFNDQEMINDALYSQKQITENYNIFANECSASQVRDTFLNLLNEEHRIQADVFNEISKRGWYSSQPADQQQIQQAKQKFNSMINSLQ